MVEGEACFSEKEKADIAEVARASARLGEGFVDTLVNVNIRLWGLAIRGGNGVVVDGVFYTPTQIRHEVDVVGEIIKQARLVLQFEGRDGMSELEKRLHEAGWGSLFDPESEASRRLKDKFGR